MAAPARMVAMGRAGRRHARRWTARGYAEDLVGFALRHRALLQRRGKDVFHTTRPCPLAAEDGPWLANLGRARAALIYLDRNVLPVEPVLVLAMSHDELCDYVGDVILGVFGSSLLRRALSRYLARLDRRGAYWACTTFVALADGVLSGDETACRRLMNGTTPLEPEFWAVVEHLPSRHFLTAATLMLAKRPPTDHELSQCERDDHDGFPLRSRLPALLSQLNLDPDAVEPLRLWAEESAVPTTQCELLVLDDAELDVGSAAFRQSTDLSGFHTMENDRVWTRGDRGFIGLRLAGGTAIVELKVSTIRASPDQPCEIVLAYQDKIVRTEARDRGERWIQIVVDVDREVAGSPLWLSISTSRPGAPEGTSDKRVLGVCLLQMRITAREDLVDLDKQRMLAVSRLNETAIQMRASGKLEREDELQSTG